MGSEQSRPGIPPWHPPQGGSYSKELEEKLRQVSKSASTFLEPHPGFNEVFQLEELAAECSAALEHDENIQKWLPKLVPKR